MCIAEDPLICPCCGSGDYPDCCEWAKAKAEEWLADEQHEFSD